MSTLALAIMLAFAGTKPAVGEVVFSTPGTYNWTVPPGVTSVCVVAIGGGDGQGSTATSPGTSSFNNSLYAYGSYFATGGGYAGADGGGIGGQGGAGYYWHVDGYPDDYLGGGGGGAAGYTGNGGPGGAAFNGSTQDGWSGGGVGLYGQGTSASGAPAGGGAAGGSGGGAGSVGGAAGGSNGTAASTTSRATPGLYGGGIGGTGSSSGKGGGGLGWKNNIPVTPGQVIPIKVGTGGAVRVMYGPGRSFPYNAAAK